MYTLSPNLNDSERFRFPYTKRTLCEHSINNISYIVLPVAERTSLRRFLKQNWPKLVLTHLLVRVIIYWFELIDVDSTFKNRFIFVYLQSYKAIH